MSDQGPGAGGWVEGNQRYVSAALGVLRCRVLAKSGTTADLDAAEKALIAAREGLSMPPAIESARAAFELSEFERDVLLLSAGVELDTSLADACAAAHGDQARRYATFGLALAALPGAHWSALTPAAALRRWHLVEMVHPEILTSSPLRVDERMLHAIAGISYLDPRLDPIVRPVEAQPALPERLRHAAKQVVSLWSAGLGRPRVQLHGQQRSDLLAVAASAAAGLGLRMLRISATDLVGPAGDRSLLARLCEREAALTGVAYALDVDDAVPEAVGTALDFSERLNSPSVLVTREPLTGPDPRPVAVAVPSARAAEARALWSNALGPHAAALDGWIDRAAGQFDLGVGAVNAVTAEVLSLLDEPQSTDRDRVGRWLWDACRAQARPALDELAQRIEPRARWNDLVLPETQTWTLRQIVLHVRYRLRVMDDWGFADRTTRGLGTAALFWGPSGTGKTLAAEVLAADLGLDLYRIDLSQVMSKYIGETEKNLRRVFDAAEGSGAVLLFDEADALFGKRSEVKDSHDRYANIEVSYLLQRMETYRGLAILTTNLKAALDPAFLRRLRFLVSFPFPDTARREEIWRRIFPPQTPTAGLDPAKLAMLNITGGTIHNIALSAAFLAAGADEPVQMSHLLQAARMEYGKLEKPLTDAEVAGWTTQHSSRTN